MNAVSLYVEKGKATFERVHVQAASDLASAARKEGVSQFIQISGIGSNSGSRSPYIGARGRGQDAVLGIFSDAAIVRPAVMIGPEDSFLTTIIALIRALPIYPLFGEGETRLQPAYVGDVAEGIGRLIERGRSDSIFFEFAGPHVYSYRELLEEVARLLGARIRVMPFPYAAWDILAAVGERLPFLPITRNQVDLMRHDNIAGPTHPGLPELGIDAVQLAQVVKLIRQENNA